MEDNKVATKVLDPTEYNEIVTTKNSEMIDAFSSKIIHARMKTAFTSARLNIMSQALCAEEGSLLQGLTIQNAYTEIHNDSKSVVIVVRKGTAYPQTLKTKTPVARVVAANCMPEVQIQPGMMDTLDQVQGIQTLKMTTEQRQEKLFKKLRLEWPRILASGAGRFPPCQVSQHFFLRSVCAWLYLFD